MVDFNAKLGSHNRLHEDVMGQHADKQMNKNGGTFSDFCGLNNLIIGRSVFPHKRLTRGYMDFTGREGQTMQQSTTL